MYKLIFYLTAVIAIGAAGAILIVRHPVHAALYLIASLLALALLFFLLGAPLVAALQVILYAGAIMVLFLFVMMVMDLRPASNERLALPKGWRVPTLLVAALAVELAVVVFQAPLSGDEIWVSVGPKAVGQSLFGTYLIAVEVAAILLLAALVAVLYLSRRSRP